MLNPTHLKLLNEAILKRGWDISENAQENCLRYVELLHKWNAVHNLTAIHDPIEMIHRHIIDSLTLYPWIISSSAQPVQRIVDVGTGAGLPGIILAICLPELSFVLLDSNQKKINFVQHVVLSLQLKNVSSVCCRVEQYKPSELFDWVVSRAYASLANFVISAGHLCRIGGRWVAMKGQLSEQERAELPTSYTLERCEPIDDPESKNYRCLVFIKRAQDV